MKRTKQNVNRICDIANLPADYVPLGKLAHKGGATPLYGYVQRAFNRGEWTHQKWIVNGKQFIHKDDLARLTSQFESAQSAQQFDCGIAAIASVSQRGGSRIESAIIALCEINNALALMLPVLERIATAVENIATQPHPAEHATRQDIMATIGGNGTWRDMNGESH